MGPLFFETCCTISFAENYSHVYGAKLKARRKIGDNIIGEGPKMFEFNTSKGDFWFFFNFLWEPELKLKI